METNRYLKQAKAAIARAEEMLAKNESTVEEFETKLGGGEYSDSASREPKPFKGSYTQNHGGMVSARTNALFILKDEWRKLADAKGSPWDRPADFALISEACDYIEEQSEALGFEL